MQPLVIPPRILLTSEQVTNLVQNSGNLVVGKGLELIDRALNVVEDITGDLRGGSVTRSSYATLHGTGQLFVSRELDFGAALIRPFMTLTDGVTTAKFHLGAYFTSTPVRNLGEDVVTYDIECYDILQLLDDPVGGSFAIAAGTKYLAAVEQILIARGVVAYLIDQEGVDLVLPTDRVWRFDDRTTWLNVINDLLGSIGYQGIWSDWDGMLRCQPYRSPRDRGAEWTYNTYDPLTSTVDPDRTYTRDFFSVPNRWVVYRGNNVDQAAPVDGDGIYTYTNATFGDTSAQARGRVITKVVSVDVADHASLVVAAQSIIDADLFLPTVVEAKTSPNPLHWHFDRVTLDDPGVGPASDVVVTKWTLPLDSNDMTHEWTIL